VTQSAAVQKTTLSDDRQHTSGRLEQLQVQTRFFRLGQPAALGDRIDGWRVCWVGGWDHAKVLFVVMVERVGRAARS
jgi:hypothetical protein